MPILMGWGEKGREGKEGECRCPLDQKLRDSRAFSVT